MWIEATKTKPLMTCSRIKDSIAVLSAIRNIKSGMLVSFQNGQGEVPVLDIYTGMFLRKIPMKNK